MSLDLARWQFASTSIYHFLFVPITIGLAFLVALLETGWYRNGDATYLRLARSSVPSCSSTWRLPSSRGSSRSSSSG